MAPYTYIPTYQGAQESWNKWWAPCRHHHAAMTGHSNSTDPQGRADAIWMPLAHMCWSTCWPSTHNHSIFSAISALVQALPGNHTPSTMSPIHDRGISHIPLSPNVPTSLVSLQNIIITEEMHCMVYTYVCMLQYFAQTSMTLEFRMTMGSLYYSYREVETFNVEH